MSNVVKFPYTGLPARPIQEAEDLENGTPEERAAEAAVEGINLGANKISYLVPKMPSKEINPSHPPAAVVQIRKPARPYTPPSEEERRIFAHC
jgi:hypothetical protein